MSSWKFYLMTFGCKVNQYETQSIREAWQARGGEEVATPAEADVVLVNSCAITAGGERDARNALYRAGREAPQARRILTGCAAALVAARIPDAVMPDVILPPQEKYRLLQGPSPAALAPSSCSYPPFAITRSVRARPVVKVQDGCSHRCTYCIVPSRRGPSRSREPQEVLTELRTLLAAGYRELVLSGINLHQYGRDMPSGIRFWDLLELVEKELAPQWAGRARLRISSLEPSQLTGRGLELLCSSRLVCPQLHLSLQSGSPAVLRRMGRGHTRLPGLREALRTLADAWPVMGLGADILMGFPGETEGQVQETLEFVESLPLTYAHVFSYSPRPGTAAARFSGQLPHKEKQRRSAAVRELVARKRQRFLQRQLALPRMYLALEDGDRKRGVNEYYIPCRVAALPARATGLVAVRPLAPDGEGLLVECLDGEGGQLPGKRRQSLHVS